MTFGMDLCYIVTPLAKQREIAEKLIHHWIHGYGSTYNSARGEALQKVRIMGTVQEMIDHIGQRGAPLVVGTSSRERPNKAMTYQELSSFIEDNSSLTPVQNATQSMLREKMAEVLGDLSPRESQVLRWRFGLYDGHEYTLEEVGQKFGLTRERIRQIEGKALRHLRHPRKVRELKEYL